MKHVYVTLKVVYALMTLNATTLWAQSPTTVVNTSQYNVVENFDANYGNFRSPSIYTESSYTQFNWDAARGFWLESSGLGNRSASMISGVYQNQQPTGSISIGFKYEVPAGAEYRIRIINVNCSCAGGNDILATTANGPVWTALPNTTGRISIRMLDQDLVQGQHLRFEISIRGAVTGNYIVDDFALGEIGAAPLPLPVTFLGMVANRAAGAVYLKWDVADEIDVREYWVEKSTTGASFTNIGRVTANKKPNYTFTDLVAETGVVFYRVKSVDVDGKIKYSSIMRLNGSSSYSSSLKAYPTPAINDITIEHKKLDAKAKISISTMDGKVLKTITPSIGASHTPMNLSGIPKGVYVLRLEDDNGIPESTKLIKQ